jgi:hypothetical protein
MMVMVGLFIPTLFLEGSRRQVNSDGLLNAVKFYCGLHDQVFD